MSKVVTPAATAARFLAMYVRRYMAAAAGAIAIVYSKN